MNVRAAMACLVVTLAAVAHADSKVAAEALFTEARQLIAQNKVAEAAAKLEASYKLDPATGTLLNLADCYERLGKTATAWATFMLVATDPAQPSRATFARRRADALLPTLSKLTIRAPGAPASLRVLRDGVVVAPASYGVAVPVDPGRHVVEATAEGRSPFHRQIDVAGSAANVILVIP